MKFKILIIIAISFAFLQTSNAQELVLTVNKQHAGSINSVAFSPDGSKIITVCGDATVKLVNTTTGELLLTMYDFESSTFEGSVTPNYLVVSPDGRFDGTEEAMKQLYYVKGLDVFPLANFYEKFYTSNLLAKVWNGVQLEKIELKLDDIKLPPLVEITSPTKQWHLRGAIAFKANKLTSTTKEIQVTVKVTDQGGGIDEIRLYLNGKLVETTQRSFVIEELNNSTKTKTFTISLINGQNKIKATAFSKQRTESIADEVIVFYEGAKKNK